MKPTSIKVSARFDLTAEHIAAPFCFGGPKAPLIHRQAAQARSAMGRLFASDIGKRCFTYDNGVTQVENDEQRDARLARSLHYD